MAVLLTRTEVFVNVPHIQRTSSNGDVVWWADAAIIRFHFALLVRKMLASFGNQGVIE